MNVTGIANLYRSLQANAAAPVDPVQKGLERATARLEAQRQTNQVQLSAYGQVKSGLSRIEDAGKTLTASGTVSPADTKKALQSLVSAYNETRTAAASTDPGYASNAANSLRRGVSTSSMRSDLASLGITQKGDGSLSIDTKKLDQALAANPIAVKEAASRVGGQLQESATKSLSENGGINRTLNALGSRAQQIGIQQTSIQSLTTTQTSSSGTNSSTGIDSYLRIFSM